MSYVKNTDPRYFIDNPLEGNCGSFALNIKEWYISDRDFDNTDFALKMIERGEDSDFLFESLTFLNVKTILEDFGEEIRILTSANDKIKKDEELIAFRIGIFWDEEIEDYDTDFHFRVRRNGEWMEKRGSTEVRFCGFEEGEWISEDGVVIYNGPIVYLAKKI